MGKKGSEKGQRRVNDKKYKGPTYEREEEREVPEERKKETGEIKKDFQVVSLVIQVRIFLENFIHIHVYKYIYIYIAVGSIRIHIF